MPTRAKNGIIVAPRDNRGAPVVEYSPPVRVVETSEIIEASEISRELKGITMMTGKTTGIKLAAKPNFLPDSNDKLNPFLA